MQLWLIAALVFLGSHLGAGWYWHGNGYQEAIRDAKAAQDDAVVAGIEAANELAAADLKRALAAERKRSQQRATADTRRSGLQESIRTEIVYRDRDCAIPAADVLRINDAIQAATEAGAGQAGGSDGRVPSPGPDERRDAGVRGGQAPRNPGPAGRVLDPAGRIE